VTANGSDSDATDGTPAGSEGPADASAFAWDPARAGYASQAEHAGQGAPAPGPLPGGLTSGLQMPGMAVESPALDFLLGKQRRRLRNMAAAAG
jgi:hypothetical protein